MTGYSSHRARLVMARRVARTIQTDRASAAGGHTQPAAVSAPSPGVSASRPAPVAAITTAGTAAQRCGWLVHRVVSTASSAQPEARPSSAEPVMTGSLAPANTTRTRTRVFTSAAEHRDGHRRPDRELVAPAGGQPAGAGGGVAGEPATGVGVVVVMAVSLPGGGPGGGGMY